VAITSTSAALSLAKSAVSRHLAELETRLGVSLIHRTTRRLNLTDSGHAYYARCVAIFADVEEAESAVSQAHGALRGTLKVALPLAFGLLHLAPLIQAFMSAHPDVRFELDFNDRQIDLMQEGFDLAIRIATLEDSSLIARRLAPIRHVVCASPDYVARHGTPQAAADLVQRARPRPVAFPRPRRRARAGARAGASGRHIGEFLMRAAIAGGGLVQLPSFYVHEALRTGQLLPLLTDHVRPELAAYAVYPPTRHLSSRVRAFIDFLADRLAGQPY
jgi:DNA-binding transcriptional LysR family regulator